MAIDVGHCARVSSNPMLLESLNSESHIGHWHLREKWSPHDKFYDLYIEWNCQLIAQITIERMERELLLAAGLRHGRFEKRIIIDIFISAKSEMRFMHFSFPFNFIRRQNENGKK